MSVTPTKALIDISKLENLADKVRAKTGTSDLMTVDEMATAVENLELSRGTIVTRGGTNTTYSLIPNNAGNGYIGLDTSYLFARFMDSNKNVIKPCNTSPFTEYRAVCKFKCYAKSSGGDQGLFGTTANGGRVGGQLQAFIPRNGTSLKCSIGSSQVTLTSDFPFNEWLYFAAFNNGTTSYFYLYDEDGILLNQGSVEQSLVTNSYELAFGGYDGWDNNKFYGEVDFDELFIEVNNQVIWGKTNSKNANMGLESETNS